MIVLLLGPYRQKIFDFLEAQGHTVRWTEELIIENCAMLANVNYIVSYGYRHIIKKSVIGMFPRKIINLHISYLPWNRGADPNLWSFLEDTPKGVTIHYVDEGLDTGPILVQKLVDFSKDDTLRSTYEKLDLEIERLLFDNWCQIISGKVTAKHQVIEGSYHTSRDKENVKHLLSYGWDTKIISLIGKSSRGE